MPTFTGKLLAMAPKILKGFVWLTTWASLRANSAQSLKKKLDDALRKQSQKLVIVIDDIDRLTTTEVCQIFQLVKAVANFPNTIYVLAFDNKIVQTQVSEMQPGNGVTFLEKIVQVPFFVPQISVDDVHRYVGEALLERIQDKDDRDRRRFHFLIREGIQPLLEDLRAAKRFLNVFHFTMNLYKERITITDIVGMTALHVFEPAVFDEVLAYKGLLTATGTIEHEALETLAEKARERSRGPIKAILAILFPKAKIAFDARSNMSAIGFALNLEWRAQGRICDPANFDYFFRLSMPRDEYMNDEIVTLLRSASTHQEWESLLKRAHSHGRLSRLLEGFKRHFSHVKLPEHAIQSLIETLTDLGDELSAAEPLGETQSHESRLLDLIVEVIREAASCIASGDLRIKVLCDAIERAKSTVVPMILCGRILPGNETIAKVICERIVRQAGRLIAHPRVGAALKFLESRGANRDVVKVVLDTIVRDDRALLNLIREYVLHDPRQSRDYQTVPPILVHTEELKGRVDLQRVRQRLTEMGKSSDVTERDRSLIQATLALIEGSP